MKLNKWWEEGKGMWENLDFSFFYLFLDILCPQIFMKKGIFICILQGIFSYLGKSTRKKPQGYKD